MKAPSDLTPAVCSGACNNQDIILIDTPQQNALALLSHPDNHHSDAIDRIAIQIVAPHAERAEGGR
jgi:hypothetical protein